MNPKKLDEAPALQALFEVLEQLTRPQFDLVADHLNRRLQTGLATRDAKEEKRADLRVQGPF